MPKIEIPTKYVKEDLVFFIHNNCIVRGIIKSATVHAVFGREEDPRCPHQMEDDKWIEMGDEPIDPIAPTIEYHVQLDHPVADEVGKGKPYLVPVIGSSRMFRDPAALLAYLNRKFEKAYGQKIV